MLRDKDFKYRYSTGRQDLPLDFCIQALSNSIRLDIGLGYFSSACFNVLSAGFAHFICNGGNMRLYINQYLTTEDYDLLKNGGEVNFEERILQSYSILRKVLSQRDEHFFKCLAFLMQAGRIEIKIVVPKAGGLAHEKFGIFCDENNDKIAFTGSMNMTAAALVKNIETIDCICSWKGKDNKERIEQSEQDFYEIWEGKNDLVYVYSAKKFCQEIVRDYPDVKENELLIQEEEIIRKWRNRREPKVELQTQFSLIYPHFPLKYPAGPRSISLMLMRHGLKMMVMAIFAMATGTGKTVTALNCALQEYSKNKIYRLLILVPTIALVDQWIEEVRQFDFKPIITLYSENLQWRKEIIALKNKMKRGGEENFVIISTYDSFTHKDFQGILPYLSEKMLLIADEAHNIGSESVRKVFKNLPIKRRIALSATPTRIYDAEGTEELESFFNDRPPYVYSFPMSRAIQEGCLMEYCYYPKLVYLNETEMENYAYYSAQLMKLFDKGTGEFKDKQLATKLLMQRKQVLHKAEDKIRVLREIAAEIGPEHLKYCFVYVPEGKENSNELEFDSVDNEMLIEKMLQVLKNDYPETTFNVYTSKIRKSDRKQILMGFEQGNINVLLAMKCLDEGVDIPRAEYGIFASSTGNPRQFIQRRGRLLRRHLDKTFAQIYDMIVVPDFQSSYYSMDFYDMEKSLVKGELTRVAYFADLATNTHTGALCALRELVDFYELNLSELILNINQ